MSVSTTPDGSPGPPAASPFRAFDDESFVESEASARLTAILATNGGAYALSGPRGAGKSWMMQKALAEVEAKGGLTLWYPSPSSYSAFEFLSTLSDNFANQIERRYRPDRFYPTLASSPWRVVTGCVLVVLALLLAGTTAARDETLRTIGLTMMLCGTLAALVAVWQSWTQQTRTTPPRTPRPATPAEIAVRLFNRLMIVWLVGCVVVLVGGVLVVIGVSVGGSLSGTRFRGLVLAAVTFLGGFALLAMTLRTIGRERLPTALLTREAGLLRERIRYSSRSKEGSEVSAKGGAGGFVGNLKSSRERELVERPTTIASLIHDFRLLAERAGDVSGRVVIAIDELDKIADASAVRALLRDVKGVFEIRNVFFLVSVSDEATRALKLGGIAARDEFNSSFYTIIDVPPMSEAFRLELLEQRKIAIKPEVAACLSLLTGHNPRETLRLVDPILRAGAGDDARRAVSEAMRSEVMAFREEAMTASSTGWPSGLSDDERAALADALAPARFAPDALADTAAALIAAEWEPDWAGRFWHAELQGRWQRLGVRLFVAERSTHTGADHAALGEILRWLGESPVVARRAIGRLPASASTAE